MAINRHLHGDRNRETIAMAISLTVKEIRDNVYIHIYYAVRITHTSIDLKLEYVAVLIFKIVYRFRPALGWKNSATI